MNGDKCMKKRMIRNILLFTVVPLAAIAMIYVFVSLYYMDRFYNGTWINGVNFSNKTVQEASDALKEYKSSFTLRIVEVSGDQEVIRGEDIGYAEAFDGVADIKKEQGMWNWLNSFMDVNFYTVEGSVAFDEELLRQAVNQLDCVTGKGAVKSQDAYVEFTDEGVKVVAEVQGTMADGDLLFEVLKTALSEGDRRIYLDTQNCYIPPAITTQSREIREIMAPVEKITNTTVTYTFGEDTEVLDSETIKSWIYKNEEGEITVNEEKVNAFVQSLADKYDTSYSPREFTTSYGSTVTISANGYYGWKINVKKETEALMELLKNGQSETREPVYDWTAWKRGGNEIGNTYIEISLSNQRMWFYKNGQLIVDTAIVTGIPSGGTYTPTGAYKILNKQRNQVLKGKNSDGTKYESPVSFWLPFIGNAYGIHDASWRGDSQGSYGGSIYISNGSHGCVNTPYSWVSQIYNSVDIGTPVIIY